MDVSIGKQNIKIMKNNVFQDKILSKSRRLVHLCKNMIISFCITFLQKLSRVLRHTKNNEFKEKIKSCQNHEGSSISILGIYFEPAKSCYSQVLRKRTNFGHFSSPASGGGKEWIFQFDSQIFTLHIYNKTLINYYYIQAFGRNCKGPNQVIFM